MESCIPYMYNYVHKDNIRIGYICNIISLVNNKIKLVY